ncbi:dethiobiotin synthase [Novacetimonas hansenii]|uniref:ATP-dependent dethiobiotin synthetase BioD n=2 Tax=Novacetimonas hansenii TaxID=436 RepID=A0ABQ0SE83_NOVHA|nr:dethiobiotin synthase [Novacetimonas hansenii]EFG84032.1 dethiobiotin synthase [Novacetimonas hansenii ATCC 23769]GAN83278.1 biotin synthesis protein [Novacetimonas hansenii JCM 7643]GBQ58388.1 biotin synthesis protein [Novacetimonas hansenii NRIC 0243]GEC63452.1 dethiobiotin synthase [Novacetimonas hansenii]
MTSLHKQLIARSFGAASGYDAVARIQRIAARQLAQRIAQTCPTPGPQRILEIGCGTGFLTQHLRRLFPAAQIVATDIAPGMLHQTQAKFLDDPALSCHVMDAEQPDLTGPFDLICSSMAMQWFSARHETLRRLAALLSPGGVMAFSTLCRDSFTQWRGYYATLGLPCPMPVYPDLAMLEQEWPRTGKGSWTHETIIEVPQSALSFLRELRAIGADVPTTAQVLPGGLRRVLKQADRDATFSVNYNIAYGTFRRTQNCGVFVTGTDTGVGKTLTCAVLARAWDASYWKPLQSGIADEPADTLSVATLAQLSSARLHQPAGIYAAPLSPEDAAACEGKVIDPDRIILPHNPDSRPMIVEGAGGVMVPISTDFLMLDLMERLGLPVVLVARSSLGTINHTLLSLAMLHQRNIPVLGIVLNGPDNPYARSAIERHGKVRILADFPLLADVNAEAVAQLAHRVPPWETLRPGKTDP